MPDYQITRVSEDVREWNGPKGTIFYHKVMLDGWEKPVSIGKKKRNALEPGMTISGTIERTDSPEDKWHAAPMSSFGGGGGSSNPQPAKSYSKSPEEQESIARSVALKSAVELVSARKGTDDQVLGVANIFLAWLQGSSESTDPKATSTPTNTTSATTTTTPGNSKRDERDEFNDMRSSNDEPMPEYQGE